MNYEELKFELYSEGCKCVEKGQKVDVWAENGSFIIATFKRDDACSLVFNPSEIKMNYQFKKRIYDLLVEYDKEPKQFRLKLSGVDGDLEMISYLNLVLELGQYTFMSMDQDKDHKTIFSEKDFQYLPDWAKELYDFGLLIKEAI